MSKEIAGFNNHLILHPDQTITKLFCDEGIVARSASARRTAEANALKQIAIAPQLLEMSSDSIRMQQLEGEIWLDSAIACEPERLQYETIFASGKALRSVHDKNRQPMTYQWFYNFIGQNLALLQANSAVLNDLQINCDNLGEYFNRGINFQTLQSLGISIVHGDYWLNNVIGKLNHKFELSGVIDWEGSCVDSPYQDFAIVKMSIEDIHPVAQEAFWQGYGETPKAPVVEYFCATQILTWLNEDKKINPNSPFYKPKIKLLQNI